MSDDKAPQATDLYRLYDAHGALLYIGISNSWQTRMAEHAATKEWWTHVVRSQIDHFPCRCLALHAERNAIKSENPKFNIVHNQQLPPPPPSGRAELGALRVHLGRMSFDRDELTLVWADEILPKLRPFTKALYQAGRFVGTEGTTVMFALPTEPHRAKCEDSRAEVESVLSARFGQPVTVRLTIDHGEIVVDHVAKEPGYAVGTKELVEILDRLLVPSAKHFGSVNARRALNAEGVKATNSELWDAVKFRRHRDLAKDASVW